MKTSKNHLMLMVASLALVSCGTVHTSTATLEPKSQATPDTQVAVATPPQAPVVVKSPVVPDDPEPAAVVHRTTPRKTPVAADASAMPAAPVVAEEPASPETRPVPAPETKPAAKPETKPVPEKTADATPVKPAETPKADPAKVDAPAPAAEAPPATAPLAPAETPAAEAPPTSITPPAAAPTDATPAAGDGAGKAKPPTSIFANPSSWLKDPKALLQASIGGFPVWLVILLVLLAFISLVIGFRGKKSPEPATAEIGGGS